MGREEVQEATGNEHNRLGISRTCQMEEKEEKSNNGMFLKNNLIRGRCVVMALVS